MALGLLLLCLVAALVVFQLPPEVLAHSKGAPFQSCLTLTPKHGSAPGQPANTSPYVLNMEFIINNQTGNETILISIDSRDAKTRTPFRGFVVQARFANNPDIIVDGMFTVNEPKLSKTYVCKPAEEIKFNNTWTHRNREWKEKVSAIWTPPEDLSEEIVFMATILKDKATFWEQQYSLTVTLNAEEEESHEEESHEIDDTSSTSNTTDNSDNSMVNLSLNQTELEEIDLEGRDDLNESASNYHKTASLGSSQQQMSSGSYSMLIPVGLLHSSIVLGIVNLLMLSYY